MSDRNLRRLPLATALVALVGVFRGFQAAVAVALSLAVMEIDARRSHGT